MDYMVGNTYQQSIYLAKIYVVKAADTCLIERIETLPFGQHILHTEISTALLHKLEEDIKELKSKWDSRQEQGVIRPEGTKKSLSSACGEVLFDLESVRQGDVLYSERIYHGLGLARYLSYWDMKWTMDLVKIGRPYLEMPPYLTVFGMAFRHP